MKFFFRKKMYLPAFSILMAVVLMLVLISVSTFRNLDRDRSKALSALHRQGASLLYAIEAGARSAFDPVEGEDSFDRLIRETAKGEGIAYVYITDAKGKVLHTSNGEIYGKEMDWPINFSREKRVATRVREVPEDTRYYELAKHSGPITIGTGSHLIKNSTDRQAIINHEDVIMVIGLEMDDFEKAYSTDIHHAVIMAAIVVSLGSAALFFIFVIQNYYLVDQTLKETQDYTRQVVANMANGLLSINTKGKVVSYNILALELLGLDESQIKGLDLQKIIDFDKTGISDTLNSCQSILDQEIIYQLPTGRAIPLSMSVTPILSDKEACTGAVILLRDLREIKRLEAIVRRSEKLAAIGELAAGVAHEIRNPLSSIRGFAQFLRHSLKDRPDDREYAEVMVSEVDRINQVVTDLLTLARPVVVDRIHVDLSELITHSVRLVLADANTRNISIHTDIPQDLKKIFLDKNQITQALLNLLLNALSAVSDKGRIIIGVEDIIEENRVCLWVEDDGSGISVDQQNKIFDPFFTTRKKGTGLGLAIVHKIVENHQGEIHVQSPPEEKEQGTRISLYFPKTGEQPAEEV